MNTETIRMPAGTLAKLRELLGAIPCGALGQASLALVAPVVVDVMKAEIIDPAEPKGEGPNNATA